MLKKIFKFFQYWFFLHHHFQNILNLSLFMRAEVFLEVAS